MEVLQADDGTSELMKHFLQSNPGEVDPALSPTDAGGYWQSPYYWGSIVLQAMAITKVRTAIFIRRNQIIHGTGTDLASLHQVTGASRRYQEQAAVNTKTCVTP